MRSPLWSLAPLAAAASVCAQSVTRPLPAAAPARLPYEARALELGQPISRVQYAILHALLEWKGGSQPPYSDDEAADRSLLESLGINVAPIGTQTKADREARAALEARIGEIRARRNYGNPLAARRKPMSFEQMIEGHKALISGYGSHILLARLPSDPILKRRVELAADQAKRVKTLAGPIREMTAAATDAAFNAALARFNEAAADLSRPRHLIRARGEARGAVLGRALAIYGIEKTQSLRLARAARAGSAADAGARPDADGRKRRLDHKFDGSAGGGGRGWDLPKAGLSDGDPRSETTSNVEAAKEPAYVPEDRAVTKRSGGAGRARKPGLFGLLGQLLKAAARTFSRVTAAVFS